MNEIARGNIPKELKEVKIKSIYKNKGNRDEMKYQRGIFITSTLTKLFEKIVRNRNKENLTESITKYQNGAMENRGTRDNIMAIQAVLDYNRILNREIYLVIADAEKCFDKLWLEDCCNELYMAGFQASEVKIIEELNTDITAEIETPFGKTGKIHIEKAVKQGSVMGPTMCIVSTDKINKINETTVTTIGRNFIIESLTFVDDIIGIGTKKTVEKVGRNLRTMEIQKKFTFNKEKTNIMKITPHKQNVNKNMITPRIEVGQGRVGLIKEEKYLGEWIDGTGSNKIKLEKKKEKINHMIQEVKRLGSYHKVGKMDMRVRLQLLDKIVMPALLYNMDLWTRVTKKEEEEINGMQGKILKGIFGLSTGTIYWGIIEEMEIWPMTQQIEVKKLMMLYDIMHEKNENRLIKGVVEQQKEKNFGWYKEVKGMAKSYQINVGEEIKRQSKKEWKKEVRKKIRKKIEERIREEIRDKKKLRNVRMEKWERRKYIMECTAEECKNILKIRLNMVNARANYKGTYGGDTKCRACKTEEETTEHLIDCEQYKRLVGCSRNMDVMTENIEELKQLTEYVDKVEKLKEKRGW